MGRDAPTTNPFPCKISRILEGLGAYSCWAASIAIPASTWVRGYLVLDCWRSVEVGNMSFTHQICARIQEALLHRRRMLLAPLEAAPRSAEQRVHGLVSVQGPPFHLAAIPGPPASWKSLFGHRICPAAFFFFFHLLSLLPGSALWILNNVGSALW
jgi:hypothetical protein